MADMASAVTNVTNDTSSWTEKETSQTYDMPSGLQIFIMYLISSGALLANLMVFYAVPRLKKKIKDSTRIAMLNLAVTDALLGVGSFISRTVYVISPETFFEHLCGADAYFNPFLGGMSIFGLSFLNLDKFLTLAFPLRYTIHMTSKKAAAILISIWIMFLTYYISTNTSLQWRESYLENTFICFRQYREINSLEIFEILVFLVLPVTVSIISLIGICCVMRSFRKRSRHLLEGQQKPPSNNGKASVYAVLAVNFTFLFMIMPFVICNYIWKPATGNTPGPNAYFATAWLLAANSAVNPFIYIPTMRSYRKELKRGFLKLVKDRCKCGKEEQEGGKEELEGGKEEREGGKEELEGGKEQREGFNHGVRSQSHGVGGFSVESKLESKFDFKVESESRINLVTPDSCK